jgi:transposase
VQDHAFHSPEVVHFLEHLLRHLPGKLLVIWDGAPIHRSRAIKTLLAKGAAKRLRLEQLPGNAPDEGIWAYLTYVELRNVCYTDLMDLQQHLRLATARLRHKPQVIHGLVHHAGYVV